MNAITTQSVAVRPHEGHGLAYAELEKVAASIAESGLFGIKTKSQAMALMMISIAEGRHPALAARDYDIVQNRPAKKSEAMLRDFLQGGGTVKWHALTDDEADATFSHPAGGTVRINWNMERAAKAGLATKDNYKKFARQMLRSRTVSEGVRTVYPIATSGMYVPEEAADITNPPDTFDGPTLEAKPEPPAPSARRPRRQAEPQEVVPEETPPASEPTWLEKYTAALSSEKSLAQFIVTFGDACATCTSEPDLVRLMSVDIVKRAFEKGAAEVKDQLSKASTNAFRRLQPKPGASSQPDLALDAAPYDPDIGEITPADRLASG